jgi:hypothetical protein
MTALLVLDTVSRRQGSTFPEIHVCTLRVLSFTCVWFCNSSAFHTLPNHVIAVVCDIDICEVVCGPETTLA